ncbi:hypothetical protein FA95DRAFT_1571236 [Auriscalpium vulgare]|uniref:Uncharacterized protein n=1 Tax=Auriscalpium vulgare TaxID=40419 RepID=A0ACB8RZ20_9AGAM|nr:hypothetical protein FA95DRAFT_1571236 [Auriscalpium vulgare]
MHRRPVLEPPRPYSPAVAALPPDPLSPSPTADFSSEDSLYNSPASSAGSLQTSVDEPLELPPLAKDLVLHDAPAYTSFRLDLPKLSALRDLRAARKSQPERDAALKGSSTFNPHAAPFIPSPATPDFSNALPVSPPPAPMPVASSSALPASDPPVPQPPPHTDPYRPWKPAYEMGLAAASDEQRAFHARGAVMLRDWTGPRLQDLAWCLTWEATEAHAARPVALFVHELASAFLEFYGQDLAAVFVWHVRDYTLQTFCGWWDPNNASSVTRASGTPHEYIGCAFALARYVGDLSANHLLTAPQVHLCLDVLVSNLASPEQVRAVRDILLHAGPQLCEGQVQRNAIGAVFEILASKRERFDQTEARAWFTDISSILSETLSPWGSGGEVEALEA